MSITGERSNAWERDTWPVLEALARDHPEAGVHFQELRLYIRKKDAGTPKAQKSATTLLLQRSGTDDRPDLRMLQSITLGSSGVPFLTASLIRISSVAWSATLCVSTLPSTFLGCYLSV